VYFTATVSAFWLTSEAQPNVQALTGIAKFIADLFSRGMDCLGSIVYHASMTSHTVLPKPNSALIYFYIFNQGGMALPTLFLAWGSGFSGMEWWTGKVEWNVDKLDVFNRFSPNYNNHL